MAIIPNVSWKPDSGLSQLFGMLTKLLLMFYMYWCNLNTSEKLNNNKLQLLSIGKKKLQHTDEYIRS